MLMRVVALEFFGISTSDCKVQPMIWGEIAIDGDTGLYSRVLAVEPLQR